MQSQERMAKKIAELEAEGSPGSTGRSPAFSRGGGGGSHHARSPREKDLEGQVKGLQDDLKRRQESYVARERAFVQQIDGLNSEISDLKGRGGGSSNDKIKGLREMHTKVMENIDHVQGTTSRILQEQERDLLRAFRARLFDVQTELEKEKGRLDDG